jgi:DNA-binding NtrC family response regulator
MPCVLSRSPSPVPDFWSRVATYEIGLIEEALKATHGHKTRAAALLGMPVRTLSHKIKVHGIRLQATSMDAAITWEAQGEPSSPEAAV